MSFFPGFPIKQRYRLALYALAVALLLFVLFGSWHFDDSFITFRYALNIATGNGFTFNPGEHVLSTTTPLFALLLALFAKAGASIEMTAGWVSALSVTAGGLIIWAIGQRIGPTRESRILIGLSGLLLYPASPWVLQTFSAETPLFLALCLGAAAARVYQKDTAAGLLSGLVLLTRPDGIVLVGLLFLDGLVFRRTSATGRPTRFMAALAMVLTPWSIYATLKFGSPLPVTLFVKQKQALLTGSIGFLQGLQDLVAVYARLPFFWIMAVLVILGVSTVIRQRSRHVLFILWPVLHILAFSLAGVTRYFWYYAPIIPGLVIMAGIGAGGSADWLKKHFSKTPKAAFLPALLVFLVLIGQGLQVRELIRRPDPRYAIYRTVGNWLAENTPEDASIGLLEVGIIGFYANPRPVVDFAGLVQPEVAEQFTSGYNYDLSAAWAAERFQPDYLVLFETQFNHLIATYRADTCTPIQIFYGADYGYERNLVVYAC